MSALSLVTLSLLALLPLALARPMGVPTLLSKPVNIDTKNLQTLVAARQAAGSQMHSVSHDACSPTQQQAGVINRIINGTWTDSLSQACVLSCFGTPSCLLAVNCWFCQFAGSAVPLLSSVGLQPCANIPCRCQLYGGQWNCPVQPSAGGAPLQVPAYFAEDPYAQTAWYYLVGKLQPSNPALVPLGFQFTLFRLNTVPGVTDPNSLTTSYHLEVAITNPNLPSPNGYQHASVATVTIPQALIQSGISASGAFSISTKLPLAFMTLAGYPVAFTLSTVSGVSGKQGALWQLQFEIDQVVIPTGTPLSMNVQFTDTKGAVFHGDGGIIRNGYLNCSTSNYISMTNMQLDASYSNTLTVSNQAVPLASAEIWFDRQGGGGGLEDFVANKSSCYGNADYDVVSSALVAAGTQQVANFSAWLWNNVHIPELGIEMLMQRLALNDLTVQGDSLLTNQFGNDIGAFGTVATGTDPVTLTGTSFSLSANQFSATILESAPFYTTSNYPPTYFPVSVRFQINHPLLTMDLTCTDVKYADGSYVLQNYWVAPPGTYEEGLFNCEGTATYTSTPRDVCFVAPLASWAYVERTNNVHTAPTNPYCYCLSN